MFEFVLVKSLIVSFCLLINLWWFFILFLDRLKILMFFVVKVFFNLLKLMVFLV